MILAEKIMNERKKNGWSQEELAEQLSVSRQSVSKWEGAQAVPDLSKIIKMAEIFGVTCDYLLKDELEPEDLATNRVESSDAGENVRKVSMEEAVSYMDLCKKQSKSGANAISLLVSSPVALIFMAGLSEKYSSMISENLAAGVGLLFLFASLVVGVGILMKNDHAQNPFAYLKTEPIETAYGVSGLVKEKKKEFESTYSTGRIIGVGLCMTCAVPLIVVALMDADDFALVVMVCVLLLMVAAGVNILCKNNAIWSSYEVLLQENEYSRLEKKDSSAIGTVMGIYWSVVTAVYLGWSFYTNDWQITWIVWAVGGVLSAGVKSLAKLKYMKS